MRIPLLLDPIQPYDQPSRDALALPHAAVDLICSVLDGSGWTGADRRDQGSWPLDPMTVCCCVTSDGEVRVTVGPMHISTRPGTRTRTEPLLRRVPLPIGVRELA